jgi:hypothetical protein
MMVVSVIFIFVALLGLFAVITRPVRVLNFTVSFSILDLSEEHEFRVPFLHEWVQVEVTVNSGNLLWNAKILNQNSEVWSYRATQLGHMTYKSEWIELSSGTYNFTFNKIGIGSLTAEIKVVSKGGFW